MRGVDLREELGADDRAVCGVSLAELGMSTTASAVSDASRAFAESMAKLAWKLDCFALYCGRGVDPVDEKPGFGPGAGPPKYAAGMWMGAGRPGALVGAGTPRVSTKARRFREEFRARGQP